VGFGFLRVLAVFLWGFLLFLFSLFWCNTWDLIPLYIPAERRALLCPSVCSFYCANACDYFIIFVCIILIKS